MRIGMSISNLSLARVATIKQGFQGVSGNGHAFSIIKKMSRIVEKVSRSGDRF